MRILLNANMGKPEQWFLAERGHDAVIASDALPPATPDPEVARFAIQQRRHVVTLDNRFAYELRLAGIRFSQALVTLRCRGLRDEVPLRLALLGKVLTAYPEWQAVHYIVEESHIRVRDL
jgi:predicted nuclease of predicted toxin-antitoxin system